jgi:hypothetical protein
MTVIGTNSISEEEISGKSKRLQPVGSKAHRGE